MADHLQLRGAVVVDAGAVSKLRDGGKSLLPIGVTEVQGEFHRGDVIAVRDMMYLSMTYDHRLVDGADAARYLSFVKARLEEGDFGAEFGL